MRPFANIRTGENSQAIVLLFSCIFTAYVADMLMVPYYPQFFQEMYGVDDPKYIGLLIALCRTVMMLTYPLWAKLSKKIPTLQLLLYTQGLAGITGLACIMAPNEWFFLFFSMISVGFKSSYLLIYPLLVDLAGRDKQTQTVSIFGFITHSATVIAAIVAGSLLDHTNPIYLLIIKCLADWIQLGISWWLIKNITLSPTEKENSSTKQTNVSKPISAYGISWLIFLYYISISLIRPYFTRFIDGLSLNLNATELGMLFVLPAAMSIIASLFYKKLRLDNHIQKVIVIASVIIVLTIWMQVAGQSLLQLINGRVFYGLALFVIQAGMDLIIFRNSKSGDMAWNYRLVTTATNAALIVAPLSMGYIIEFGDLYLPFYISMAISAVFAVSAIVIFYPFNLKALRTKQVEEQVV